MICNNCGKENNDGAKYCRLCGQKLEIASFSTLVCPACGCNVDSEARFCKRCGADITQASVNNNNVKNDEICPSCGKPLRKGKKFCGFCGYEVNEKLDQCYQGETIEIPAEELKNNVCPECGIEVKEGKKFCGNCGATLIAQDEMFFEALEYKNEDKKTDELVLEEWLENEAAEVNAESCDIEGNECSEKASEEICPEEEEIDIIVENKNVGTEGEAIIESTNALNYNVCPNCGAPLREGIHFCGQCGTSLFDISNIQSEPVERSETDITNIPVEELKTLKEMFDEGVLSQEEFDATKKKLLGL